MYPQGRHLQYVFQTFAAVLVYTVLSGRQCRVGVPHLKKAFGRAETYLGHVGDL